MLKALVARAAVAKLSRRRCVVLAQPLSIHSRALPQVRHYYYRLIKRLNKILGVEQRLDIKNPLQVHRAMAKFWDVVSGCPLACCWAAAGCAVVGTQLPWWGGALLLLRLVAGCS